MIKFSALKNGKNYKWHELDWLFTLNSKKIKNLPLASKLNFRSQTPWLGAYPGLANKVIRFDISEDGEISNGS